jgi:hypothetical protein
VSRADGPTLAELQGRFFELVTAREGVAAELAARGLGPETLAAIIAGDARADAVARLDVYANMYFFRILDALRADYPKLVAVLGDDVFHNLATDYLQAHPSRHPSLRFVGAALPGFLARHAFAEERPWVADLAALEWARADVFDRVDEAPLSREALATLAPEAFATLPLKTIAASALVPTMFAVEDPWRALENGEEPTPPARADGTHAIVVWRRGVVVQHRAVTGPERRVLDLVRAGTTFGALCAALVAAPDGGVTGAPHGGIEGEDTEEDAAASTAALAAQLLGQWLADELLVRV